MEHRIFSLPFSRLYPTYLQKVQRKGRTQAELDALILWLTGFDAAELQGLLGTEVDLRDFFAQAPALERTVPRVTGVVCGVRVEAVEDPLMRSIRCLDKLVDELAKGRSVERILAR
ncbi:MAG: DUF2200 domain-containing protein [Burkholderiales bacterium]|uniref:DUF2200 domain-containing protein n=1 Tax=Inhella sp. TaxID=1921806 RepID=UPI001AC26A49|nr:DUF2200 domain-containing protein [Burkholderiales bacterium]